MLSLGLQSSLGLSKHELKKKYILSIEVLFLATNTPKDGNRILRTSLLTAACHPWTTQSFKAAEPGLLL